ncbi:MAG: ParB N-terminal domain-containing protein [Pseudomonadota bacterium]
MSSQTPADFTVGDIVHLTIGQLLMAKDNPRRGKEKEADPVLIGSIRSCGLLQNLGVRPSEKSTGKFEVKYGSRRHAALKALLKEGHFSKDDTFSCRIASADPADWEEEQIAENIARKAMNPVDEYEAFARLVIKGLTPEEIAVRFGADVRAVKQRLALGQAAPCVRKALRAEDITLDVAKIFAGCPDLARQERVFKEIAKNGHFGAHAVKRKLHEEALSDRDDIVKFVTLDAYKEAGGVTEVDLFDGETRLLNVELVYRLREKKLNRQAQRLTEEGWSWVEAHEGYSYQLTNGFDRLYGKLVEKTPDELAEIDAIEKEMEALNQEEGDGDDEAYWDRYESLEERLTDLQTGERVFSDDQKSVSGCILYPRGEGVEVVHGLVRKQDRKKVAALKKAQGPDAKEGGDKLGDDYSGVDLEGEGDGSGGPEYGVGLSGDLSVFKAQTLQAAIAMDPATAILAHQFMLVYRIFKQPHYYWPSGCEFSAKPADLRVGNGDLGETTAAAILDRQEGAVRTDIFTAIDWHDAWAAFRTLSDTERGELVALAIARTIEPMSGSGSFMALVASELDIDPRAYWKPTADNFFARIKKDQMICFLEETVGAEEAKRLSKDGKAKKADLVDLCEGLINDNTPSNAKARERLDQWLPAIMAFPAPERPEPDDWMDDEDDSDFDASDFEDAVDEVEEGTPTHGIGAEDDAVAA